MIQFETLWLMAERVQLVLYIDESRCMGKAFHTLIVQDQVDETTVMPDSTTVKVHQYGAGSNRKKRLCSRIDGERYSQITYLSI